MPKPHPLSASFASSKFLIVQDVASPSATENDNEVELRAHCILFNDGQLYELDVPFRINTSMNAQQKEAALIASANNEFTSNVGIGDMAWPWFR